MRRFVNARTLSEIVNHIVEEILEVMLKNIKEINDYLLKLNAELKFSGSVLITDHNEIIHSEGYGMSNYELHVPNTVGTKFRIASVTKPITAIATLKLVEKGLLDLNTCINEYLVGFPNGELINIHHLLSHTSGIYNFTNSSDFMGWFIQPQTIDEVIERFKDKPLSFRPGESFEYSNSNYVLLTKIIEILGNCTFEEFLIEQIFLPCRMQDSGIDVQDRVILNRASGYMLENNELRNSPNIQVVNSYGSGCLYSTVEDLYRLESALNRGELLSSKLKDKMFTPNFEGFGYGWIIQEEDNCKILGHSGGIHGFSSIILKYVEEQICIVVLSNIFQPVDEIAREIVSMIRRR